MKVFIVWTIPDYIGIDVEGVYSTFEKAEKKVLEIKDSDPEFWNRFPDSIGIDEYEVDNDRNL